MADSGGMLCTIDSGAKAGIALWWKRQLVYCRLVRAREVREWQLQCLQSSPIAKAIVEVPIVRSNEGTKVNPNNLITLGVSAGRLVPALCGEVETVIPNQWKGQLPDDILYRRIRAALSDEEKALIPNLAEGLLHNVLDAIGIGINALGRWPRPT